MNRQFVHLRLKTVFSPGESICVIEPTIQRARELGFQALAITDRNTLAGVVPFCRAARASGIKPVIGCELAIKPQSPPWKPSKLILLAKNETGYKNLLTLISSLKAARQMRGLAISDEQLFNHANGLIALSGGPGSEARQWIDHADPIKSRRIASWTTAFEPGDFYIELCLAASVQANGLNRQLANVADEFQLPVAATNDARFLAFKDFPVFQYVQSASPKLWDAPIEPINKRMLLLPGSAMIKAFAPYPAAIANTVAIAARCDFQIELGKPKAFPRLFQNHSPSDQALITALKRGFRKRFALAANYRDGKWKLGSNATGTDGARGLIREALKRLNYEWAIMSKRGLSSAFLFLAELTTLLREQRLPFLPRRQAAGSMLLYLLGVSEVDPIEFGLLSEAFWHSAWKAEFSLDIPELNYDAVLDCLRQRVGQERFALVSRFSRHFPSSTKHKVTGEVLEMVDFLNGERSVRSDYIVVSSSPMTEHIPLTFTKSGERVTDFTAEALGELGFSLLELRPSSCLSELAKLRKRKSKREQPSRKQLFSFINDHPDKVFLGAERYRGALEKKRLENIEDLVWVITVCQMTEMVRNGFLGIDSPENILSHSAPLLLGEKIGIEVYCQEVLIQAVARLTGWSLSRSAEFLVKRTLDHERDDKYLAEFARRLRKRGSTLRQARELFNCVRRSTWRLPLKADAAPLAMMVFEAAQIQCSFS